ncbi:hypothetical protein [Anabaena sp. 4-3]|uniref:hypothetical protein n=1 Tax=Anabaena sp. 4-3 TaxID=1811979 RepID=UPI00082C41A1|nr:hypothetical protein [Anabaena sp. 4-3]
MKPFVGVKEALPRTQLLELIKKFSTESSYYFWRYSHQVSGIKEQPPTNDDFPMLEGQIFNNHFELRWKQKYRDNYEVLLLTITDNYDNFQPIGKSWRIEPQNYDNFPSYAYPAYGYGLDKTRFPKEFSYPKSLDIRVNEDKKNQPKLGQRYFIDNETSTVQFVALTVEVN